MDDQMPAGGASRALDLSMPRDRAALRTAMSDWPKRFRAITPEKRDNWVNELEDARATVKNIADKPEGSETMRLAAVAELRSCIQTSAMLDMMQMRDEHVHASGKLKDQHHLEGLAQADRHHSIDSEREDNRLRLDAAKVLAEMTTEQKEALIRRAGMGRALEDHSG